MRPDDDDEYEDGPAKYRRLIEEYGEGSVNNIDDVNDEVAVEEESDRDDTDNEDPPSENAENPASST